MFDCCRRSRQRRRPVPAELGRLRKALKVDPRVRRDTGGRRERRCRERSSGWMDTNEEQSEVSGLGQGGWFHVQGILVVAG